MNSNVTSSSTGQAERIVVSAAAALAYGNSLDPWTDAALYASEGKIAALGVLHRTRQALPDEYARAALDVLMDAVRAANPAEIDWGTHR